ncbi:hypothetical protein [Alicyclobacillus hesperidum]|nr:hypothetical protein [Alicyclobacillus hesperidum]
MTGGRAGLQSAASTREQELGKWLQEAVSQIGEQAMEIDVLRKNSNWGRK